MKSFVTLSMIVAILAVPAFATPDIQFTPGGTTPGGWFYVGATPTSGVFTFAQEIDIDAVLGLQTDTLYDEFVYLPDLTLTNYVSGIPGNGVLSASGNVEIRDGVGTLLLSGTLTTGNYYAVFGTSNLYPELAADITITYVDKTWGSAYLNSVNVGDPFDLNITLQASDNFDTVITNVGTSQNGFSGSMTNIVPEPATLALLGLGGLFLRKRQ